MSVWKEKLHRGGTDLRQERRVETQPQHQGPRGRAGEEQARTCGSPVRGLGSGALRGGPESVCRLRVWRRVGRGRREH